MKKIVLSTLLVGSLFLAACGNGSGGGSANETEDGKVEITFLNGFTGGDGAYMNKITDGFNESQDEYVVEEVQDKDHYTKFKTGDYDLVVIHANNLETYKQDGMIQDVNPLMEQAGLSIGDFHEAAEDLVTFDDGTYGIPLDIHPLTAFYNKQLSPEAPENYEDLVALTDELQSQDPNLYATGVPNAGLVEYYIMTAAIQNNVELLEGNHLNFAQEEFADALMVYHDMIWKDNISPAGLGLDGEFQAFMKQIEEGNTGVQTAVALTGPWYYQAVSETYGEDLGITSMPQIGDEPGVYGGAHTIALPSSVTDEEEMAAISAFIEYMYQPENLANWAESGQAPLHTGTLDLIAEDTEKYPLANENAKQFDTVTGAPQVYQYGEQMRYMIENVFSMLVTEENLTKEDLMAELQTATDNAQQIADTAPEQ